VLRKGELGLFDNFEPGPASLASEATMMTARLYNKQRWTNADDQLLRSSVREREKFDAHHSQAEASH
jgi:hypothetical protein